MTLHLLICGTRTFADYPLLCAKLDALTANYSAVEVVSGCARGADTLGEQWAAERGHSVKRFPADWVRYGRRAGYIRNMDMANDLLSLREPTMVVAFWDGESRGTKHMIDIAREAGLAVRVVATGAPPAR